MITAAQWGRGSLVASEKMAVGKLVVLVGAVLLLHAGYSAVER